MLHILVADDYTDAADSLSRILRAWGHYCAVAYDSRGAVKLAADRRPDVVFLDVGMPGLDGHAVARQLLSMHHDLPIYAVAGRGRLIDAAKTKEAGFVGHLLKPVDLAHLRAVLNSTKRPAEIFA